MEQYNHQASIQRLEDEVKHAFAENFPYERGDYRFEVKDITFDEPDVSHEAQQQAFLNDGSIEEKVKGTIDIYYKGKLVKSHPNVILTRVPFPTDRGSYITGGNETVVLNRMQMRNGIYVHPVRAVDHTQMLTAEVRAGKQRFTIDFDTNKATFKLNGLTMDYGKTSSSSVDFLALLKFLGVSADQIESAIGDEKLYKAAMGNASETSGRKIYGAFFSKEFPGNEEAKKEIEEFLNGSLPFDSDSQKINNQTISHADTSFNPSTMLHTLSQLAKEYKAPGASPNPDDLRFKIIKSPEDTVGEYVEKGIKEFINKKLRRLTYTDLNSKKDGWNAKPDQYIYTGTKQLYSSDVSELVDSPNPLDAHQKLYKLTSLGSGGLNDRAATKANRNMQDTAFAKIDAVETPQSGRMGLVQHFANGAVVKNGRLYSKFFKVSNGTINNKKIVDNIDPLDEFNEYIAFNNPPELVQDGNHEPTGFKNDMVKVRHQGKFIEVPKNQVTLIDYSPIAHLSHSISLIPFGAHNDGARMLMGASMQKQAMALDNPEAPIVQSIADPKTGKTVEQEMAERASYILKSPVAGTVKNIADDSIDIDTGNGVHKVKKLNYFTIGKAGGYINHTPVVKVGDKVKAGDLLADGWQSKNGQLAMGKNTLVGYMPFRGYNFEDGVVVSQSFADKMASEEVKTIEVEMDSQNGTVVFNSHETVKLLKDLFVSSGVLSKLDENGIIKKGEEIHAGDILVGAVKEKEKDDLSEGQKDIRRMLRNKLVNLPGDNYKNISREAVGYQKGKVISVNVNHTETGIKVTIKLLAFKPMELGDKLSGRHGNKGTITKIMPDSEMPHTKDGKPLELLFSPLAVPSRKNVGQLMEVNASLVAEKKGMPVYKVQNFNSSEKDKLAKHLEEIGIPDGKQKLINPETGKEYENPVTVGKMYILKLKHKVESKITERNMNGDIDPINLSPRKTSGSIDGDRRNPQSIGGMEFWSLTSAGAVHNIHDMTTLKSDGAGDLKRRREIFTALRKGIPVPEPLSPQTVKTLKDKLYAAGVKMTPLQGDKEVSLDEKYSELMLNPLKHDQLEALAPKAVTSSKGMKARTNSFMPGGIYDPEIFGEKGDQWGRINLVNPMPNPLFLEDDQGPRPYEAMLYSKGFKQRDIKNLVQGKKFLVVDPKDSGLKKNQLVDMEELDNLEADGKEVTADTGGAALGKLLQGVDLKTELKDAETRLKEAKTVAQRSTAEKHVMVLSRAIDNGLKPEDFMMKAVPVLPVKYREPLSMGNGKTFSEDGISRLYSDLLKKNESFHDFLEHYDHNPMDADRAVYSNAAKEYYTNLKNIIGVGDPAKDDKRGQDINGIMHSLKSKHGFIRQRMQSKMQDYSGRSVIIVDPTLKLDQVALPEDMAASMFAPQVMGYLQRKKYPAKEIETFIKNRTPEYREALEEVTKDHPVILNRAPSLHRHSTQAFYPKINWNTDTKHQRAIGLNPVVTTGFNADFDGDQMAVHVPITDAAIKEAKDKLLPSKNLLNPTHNGIIMDLKHEMQLGVYYMTRDRQPEGKPKEFATYKQLMDAYHKGDVKTYDAVTMAVPGKGKVTATAGQHLFNLALPQGFQDYSGNLDINKKKLDNLLSNIINSKNGGAQKAVDTINNLQTLGFHIATTSGLSIGIKDFDKIREVDKNQLFDAAEKAMKEKYKDKLAAGMLDGREAWEQEKSDIVKGQLKKMIETSLDKNNPVEIMRSSGARGNAGQINAMAGIIGVGANVVGDKTRPVNASHIDGLSPSEFWDLSYDSRKGILDKSISTAEPGALTREIWMTNKQTVISEHDCGDTIGIWLDMNKASDKRALHGRVLIQDVPLKGGKVIKASRQPLSIHDEEQIMAKAKSPINVRSPLTCKATSGVCQMCYGAAPGSTTNAFVEIGTPVGSIAAQALGEPSTQAILKAFHVGGANSKASGAYEHIQETLRLPQKLSDPSTEAVIAHDSGVITAVDHDPITGYTVKVGKKKYKLNHKLPSEFVKPGVEIQRGDLLTKEFDAEGNRLVIRNPHDVLKYQGVDVAKQYLTQALEEAYQAGDIQDTDRRHYEIVTNNLSNKAVIHDPGNSPYQSGQLVPIDAIKKYNRMAGSAVTVPMNYQNRMNVVGSIAAQDYHDAKLKPIVTKGDIITEDAWDKLKNRSFIKVKKKPIQFEQKLIGVNNVNLANQNWLDTAAYRDATRSIGEATVMGYKDKLDTPLTRQMVGMKGNFAEGFQEHKEKSKPTIETFMRGFL